MNKHSNNDLSPELEALLDNSRPLEELDLDGLKQSILDLEKDPAHVSETRRAAFLEDVMRALQDDGLKSAELARRMGKTRQQLNYMLDEENPKNFTIDTMAQISTALDRRLVVRMFKPEVELQVSRSTTMQSLTLAKRRELINEQWSKEEGKCLPDEKIIPFPMAS